jgi:hypothetical protein
MSRLFSMALIGIGGYYAYKNRFRLVNLVLGSPMIRRWVVSSLMNLPFVRNLMTKTAFSGRPAF